MILGGALLLVIVLPFEIIEEIRWKGDQNRQLKLKTERKTTC